MPVSSPGVPIDHGSPVEFDHASVITGHANRLQVSGGGGVLGFGTACYNPGMLPSEPDDSLRHRIAAGGIIIKDGCILLVRYPDGQGGSYMAAPGGKLEWSENITRAVVREVWEETRIRVEPLKVLAIEDLQCRHYKMSKTWMLCTYLGGDIAETPEAQREGITAAGWFGRKQLALETVYPSFLLSHDWQEFSSPTWQVLVMDPRTANF